MPRNSSWWFWKMSSSMLRRPRDSRKLSRRSRMISSWPKGRSWVHMLPSREILLMSWWLNTWTKATTMWMWSAWEMDTTCLDRRRSLQGSWTTSLWSSMAMVSCRLMTLSGTMAIHPCLLVHPRTSLVSAQLQRGQAPSASTQVQEAPSPKKDSVSDNPPKLS